MSRWLVEWIHWKRIHFVVSRWLVGGCEVSSSPSTTSGATPLALSVPSNCRQLGVFRPWAIQQGSVSWDADRHHLGEGLPDKLGLSDFKFWQTSSSPPVYDCGKVASASRPHGILGAFCFQGPSSDAPSSVAAEDPLVSSVQRSSAGFHVPGIQRVPLQVSLPSLLLYIDTSLTGWGALLLDTTVAGVWSWEERDLHINILEMNPVQLALNTFCNWLAGELFILMSDNAILVVYLKKQGDVMSKVMCDLAQEMWCGQSFTR